MFVRYVRAAAIGVAFACAAGFAAAQQTQLQSPSTDEHSYVADPAESFVVEHPNSVAAVTARPEPPAPRCREYTADSEGAYERGLACPQADGSWRIVSGPEEQDEWPVQEERASANAYSDYTDDEPDYRDEPRTARRFRLDWNAWRRDSDRAARGRFNE